MRWPSQLSLPPLGVSSLDLGRLWQRRRPFFFVCTHMELNCGLVDLYLGRVTSYPRAMATTKRSVLPDDTERTATEPAREQAVAGQGRSRNSRPVFPPIEPHVASDYCLLP